MPAAKKLDFDIQTTIGPDGKEYRVCHGTYYRKNTSDEVIRVLETCRNSKQLIRVHYGFTGLPEDGELGRDWMDEWDVYGRVGRSMGPIKIAILVPPGEDGGCCILTQCIVRIRRGLSNSDLYKHPSYHYGKLTLHDCNETYIQRRKGGWRRKVKLTKEIRCDGKVHARFRSEKGVKAWLKKMDMQLSNPD